MSQPTPLPPDAEQVEVARVLEDRIASTDDVRRRREALCSLARIRVMRGEIDAALAALDEAIPMGFADLDALEGDPVFAPLRADPRYVSLRDRIARSQQRTATDRFSTAWRPELPAAERAAGVSLVWSVVRQNFVWFERVSEIDWDDRYLEVLEEVLSEPSTAAYYQTIARWLAELHDGHTDSWPPETLATANAARPPVETVRLGGKTLVSAVHDRATKLTPGDEILAIDGIGVDSWVHEHITPFVSASTPQDHDHRAYGRRLLVGSPGPVTLTVAGDGRPREVTLLRGPPIARNEAPVSFRARDGIGILTLRTFATGRAVTATESIWPDLSRQEALVIDLRANGGGASTVGWEILSWLTEGPLPIGCWSTRTSLGFDAAWNVGVSYTVPSCDGTIPDDATHRHFDGPIAVLIGPGTYSAAEDFLEVFRAVDRGLLFGSTTGGSSGQPVWYELPGGGGFRVCAKRNLLDASGATYIGQGFAPDIEVIPTADDLRKGCDPVLQRALDELRAPHSSARCN